MMNIIAWIILGLIAGALAKLIMPGTQGGGWLSTMILGIVGAIVGGFVFGLFTGQGISNSFSIGSILTAVVGALIVMFVWGLLQKRHV